MSITQSDITAGDGVYPACIFVAAFCTTTSVTATITNRYHEIFVSSQKLVAQDYEAPSVVVHLHNPDGE